MFILWNHWHICRGISGTYSVEGWHLTVESVALIPWNTQIAIPQVIWMYTEQEMLTNHNYIVHKENELIPEALVTALQRFQTVVVFPLQNSYRLYS